MRILPARLALALVLLLIAAGAVRSQDMTRLARPWGYQLPYLEAGEFILSAHGEVDKLDQWIRYDTAQDKYDYRTDEYSLGAFAVFGLSHNFVVEARLRYLPSQDNLEFDYGSEMMAYTRTETVDGSFQPAFTLAYRPLRALELGARYSSAKESTAFDYHGLGGTPLGMESERSNLSFSVTYSGKLP